MKTDTLNALDIQRFLTQDSRLVRTVFLTGGIGIFLEKCIFYAIGPVLYLHKSA